MTQITRVINKGNLKAAEKLLKVELEKQNRTKFNKELREAYELAVPQTRVANDEEKEAQYADYTEMCEAAGIEAEIAAEDYEYSEVTTELDEDYIPYSTWSTAKVQREMTTEEEDSYYEADESEDKPARADYEFPTVDTEELVHPYTGLTTDELEAGVVGYGPLAAKKKELELAKVNKQAEALLTEYPQYERDSWDIQEAEAIAYKADDTASTPLIDGIVAARGCDKSELVDKILEKAGLFKQAIGYTIGQRQVVAG